MTDALLADAGLTRADVAKITGYSQATVDKMFRATGGNVGFHRDKLVLLRDKIVSRKVPLSDASRLLRAWGVDKISELKIEDVMDDFRSLEISGDGVSVKYQPDVVLWLHKLRPPNIVHGVLALAAAALIRAGLNVRLLLDDTEAKSDADALDEQFRSHVEKWIAWAGAPPDVLHVERYSEILASDTISLKSLSDYLSPKVTVQDLLDSAKVFPLQGTTDLDRLERALDERADKLRTPFQNWLVADAAVRELALDGRKPVIATLGGEDEEPMWNVWRKCTRTGPQVRNIFIPVFAVPLMNSDKSLANCSGFRPSAFAQLIKSGENAEEKVDWVRNLAIGLPAKLHSEFCATLSADLLDSDACRNAWQAQPGPVATEMAKAVRQWFR
ncbi:MAG: hypothetical protein QOC82_1552 [Frankiaceae bacterium]|nr:hypothetical protein [Frankiaceae bacterium]